MRAPLLFPIALFMAGCSGGTPTPAPTPSVLVSLSPARSRLVTAMIAAAMTLYSVHPVGAQTRNAAFVPTYTGTLKKIAESGTVQIGYRENSPPFAFVDANRKPIGVLGGLENSVKV